MEPDTLQRMEDALICIFRIMKEDGCEGVHFDNWITQISTWCAEIRKDYVDKNH